MQIEKNADKLVKTGKMVNNALAFPGIFRGALDARARRITHAMKVAAAEAIAARAPEGERRR